MKDSKDGAILPCYRDGYGVWHYSDDTHDKVYELNKQMCDIGKTMNNPIKPLSEEVAQEITKALETTRNPIKSVKPLSDGNFDKVFEELRKILDMEKKTKKMTKAEAFEWLKGKKVNTNGKGKEVQTKLFECGVGWATNHFVYYDFGDYLLIETDGRLYHCGYEGYSYWRAHYFEEISVDDILSIEIVEEKKVLSVDCALEHAKWIMKYLREECSPHTKMIIEGDHAELVEGVKSVVWKE